MNRLSSAALAHLLAAAFFLCLFAGLAIAVRHQVSVGFDASVRNCVHFHASEQGAKVMRGVSLFGSRQVLVPAVFLTIFFLLLRGLRRDALLLALIMAGEVILENGLKVLFHRPRPMPFFVAVPESYAFPSGHALASVCFYAAVALIATQYLLRQRLRIVIWTTAILVIAMIGLSRIYLGVHYPTDVVGGYLAGIAWVIAAKTVVRDLPSSHRVAD